MDRSVSKHSKEYILAARLTKELMEGLFGVTSQQNISLTHKPDQGNVTGKQGCPSQPIVSLIHKPYQGNVIGKQEGPSQLVSLIHKPDEGNAIGKQGGPSQQHVSLIQKPDQGSDISKQQQPSKKPDQGSDIGKQQQPSNVASSHMLNEVNLEEANHNMDHLSEHDTLNHEEITCISVKRNQPCSSVDDRARVPSKGNRCMKCNKAGRVLVCSGAGCSVVVHEECMGTPATYDEKGDFSCPICVYSIANARYMEARDKLVWRR